MNERICPPQTATSSDSSTEDGGRSLFHGWFVLISGVTAGERAWGRRKDRTSERRRVIEGSRWEEKDKKGGRPRRRRVRGTTGKRKEAMKGSRVPLLALENVSVLSSWKNKAAKVQNMTKHLSQASKACLTSFLTREPRGGIQIWQWQESEVCQISRTFWMRLRCAALWSRTQERCYKRYLFFSLHNLVQYDNFIQVQRLPLLSLTAELHASEFLTHPGIQKAGGLKSDSYFYASICSESFHTCKISTKTVTLYSKW